MSITIYDPSYPSTPNEVSFSIEGNNGGVEIHPWDRSDPDDADNHAVSITVGNIDGARDEENDFSDEFCITLVDRDDFVEGLLRVFPELHRV